MAQGEGLQLLGEDLMGTVWKWHGYIYICIYVHGFEIYIYAIKVDKIARPGGSKLLKFS